MLEYDVYRYEKPGSVWRGKKPVFTGFTINSNPFNLTDNYILKNNLKLLYITLNGTPQITLWFRHSLSLPNWYVMQKTYPL